MTRTRVPLIAGNWKLHCIRSEAAELARRIVEGCRGLGSREVLVAPPFTALAAVRSVVEGTVVRLSAQDVYWEPNGAFTGEISAPMLADAGCTHVIIGHSERRQYFGDTDYTVARKLRAAAGAKLSPILCVGESLEQRERNETLQIIERQVQGGLCELPADAFDRLVIAYEPIWAIGTGRTASPEQAEEVHAMIRRLLVSILTAPVAERVRILYGGSVKPDNIDSLMACPNVDGALVGGASLKAQDFLRIVQFQEH
jgi:triosephosphate isomerase